MIPRESFEDGSTDGGSTDDGGDSGGDDGANVVPTGARNPFEYEVEDGEVQETTVGGNSIADVVEGIDYSDTSVDENEMTSDDPQTTEEIIDEHSTQGGPSNPSGGDGTPTGAGVPSFEELSRAEMVAGLVAVASVVYAVVMGVDGGGGG